MERGLLEETKVEIRSLLISSTDKMTILQVEKDFKNFVCHALPYAKLGFASTEQFLRSIPDVVTIRGCGLHAFVEYVPNKKSEHIVNLVENQKRDSNSNRRRRRKGGNNRQTNNNGQLNSIYTDYGIKSLNQHFEQELNINKERMRTNNYIQNNTINRCANSSESFTGSSNESFSNENENNGNKYKRDAERNELNAPHKETTLDIESKRQAVDISPDQEIDLDLEFLHRLLQSRKEAAKNSNSSAHKGRTLGIDHPKLQSHKEAEENKFISSQTETDFDFFHRRMQSRKEATKNSTSSAQKERTLGIDHSKLQSQRETEANELISPVGKNITNSSQKETALDINHTKLDPINLNRLVDENNQQLGERRKQLQGKKRFQNIEDEAVPPCAVPGNIDLLDGNQQNFKQRNQLIPNFKCPPQCELYDTLEIGSIISLYVYEIYSPLIFFFHVNKDKDHLLRLTTEMKKVYSRLQPAELCVEETFLQPERICAAKIADTWYRAKIIGIPECLTNFIKVKILLIDYGCISEVSVKNIKHLISKFVEIPIQVVCGRLANIKSANLYSSKSYFQTLVQNKCLYAYVVNINKDVPYLELILVDTSVTPPLKINDDLLEKGFVKKD